VKGNHAVKKKEIQRSKIQ